jgi:hypothetical protein
LERGELAGTVQALPRCQDRAGRPLGRQVSPRGDLICLRDRPPGTGRAADCVWPQNSAGGYPGALRPNP